MGHFLFPTLCEFSFNKVWVFGGSQWGFSHSSSQRWWIIKPGTVKHYQDIHHWTPRWIWANFQFYNRTEQFSPSVLQFYFGQWTHLMRALTQDDDEALIVQEKPQSKAHDDDPRELQQKHTETQVSQTKQYPDMKQTCVSTRAFNLVTDVECVRGLHWHLKMQQCVQLTVQCCVSGLLLVSKEHHPEQAQP